jgi:trehalose 6-phosphate phosphatase
VVTKVSGLDYPKHVSEEIDLLARALGSAATVYLFLDYGGTLVPVGAGPDARPEPEVLRKIEQISEVESFSTFVVSGRTVDELDRLLGIPNVGLVGQQGFEIRRVDEPTVHPVDAGLAGNLIHHLELDAHGCLAAHSGVGIENRGFGLALKLKGCDARVAREASQCFVRLIRSLDTHGQLELFWGDDGVEARIAGWHKGDAVSHILRDADPQDSLAIYIGDDVTDEDAFEAVALWSNADADDVPWFMADGDEDDDPAPTALTILAALVPRPSRATLFVRGPREVQEFLCSLAAIASALL